MQKEELIMLHQKWKKQNRNKKIVEVIFTIMVILITIGFCKSYYSTKTYTVIVTDKNIKNARNTSQYLVFTKLESGETKTFAISDNLIKWRWNSSDVYAEIEVGKTYQLEVIGWRVPILSRYENIIKFSPQ